MNFGSSGTSSNMTHLHALDLSPAAAAKEKPFGPRGVLLVGLDAKDAAAAESWFREMEGQGLPISHCSGPMLEQTAEEALLVRKRGEISEGGDGKNPTRRHRSSLLSPLFLSFPNRTKSSLD